MQNKKFRPGPAFYKNEDGSMDEFSTVLYWIIKFWAYVVVVGGSFTVVFSVPAYLERWQREPELMGFLTQCFLFVFSPSFLGIAQACRVVNRREPSLRVRFWMFVALFLAVLGYCGCLGLLIWDYTRLQDCLALLARNQAGAVIGLVMLGGCVLGGIALGWYISRSEDEPAE
jgi:hypothetical protein